MKVINGTGNEEYCVDIISDSINISTVLELHKEGYFYKNQTKLVPRTGDIVEVENSKGECKQAKF